MMVTDEMIQNIADQTNMYSIQRDGSSILTSKNEILIGIYFRMGIVRMPRVRSYCETETRFNLIVDVMSRNRFEKLLGTLISLNKIFPHSKRPNKILRMHGIVAVSVLFFPYNFVVLQY